MKTQASVLSAHSGLVISITGRHILVQDAGPVQTQGSQGGQDSQGFKQDKATTPAFSSPPSSSLVLCHPRGKKSEALVGDKVVWTHTGDGGVIESIEARKNVFFRQDAMRTKRFAANIEQIVFCIAAEPVFSEWQLARALIAAKAQTVPLVILLNKSDLQSAFAQAWKRLAPYRTMGYTVLPLTLRPNTAIEAEGFEKDSATQPPSNPQTAADASMPDLVKVKSILRGKSNLILGPSGVGKSSLINCLVPDVDISTQEISKALGSGKHTTTATTWHWAPDVGAGTALIDSPGFQEFGLHHLEQQDLAQWMPDLAEYLGHCRFYNCQHMDEPDCAVRAAVMDTDTDAKADADMDKTPQSPKTIAATRYKIYQTLHQELQQKRTY